jgi:hypothetical protein
MKFRKLPSALMFLFLLSCHTETKEMNKMVRDFANLECRAISLREQRFELANKIRFTEDTLLQPTKTIDTLALKSKLAVLNEEKQSLLHNSLMLADSIKARMDSLNNSHPNNDNFRQQFNEMLMIELSKRGCK